jgi:hypothetical protein
MILRLLLVNISNSWYLKYTCLIWIYLIGHIDPIIIIILIFLKTA